MSADDASIALGAIHATLAGRAHISQAGWRHPPSRLLDSSVVAVLQDDEIRDRHLLAATNPASVVRFMRRGGRGCSTFGVGQGR